MRLSEHLWSDAARTADVAVRTLVVYLLALLLVRLAGRRTLAQLSAFDVVVTVAAGTVVGSTALPSSPAVSDGVTVLVTLLLLQVCLGAARQRSALVQRVLDFTPRAVLRDGRLDLRRSPSSAQLTASDVASQLRRQGVTDLSQVQLAVLEPTGKVSVLRVDEQPSGLFADPGTAAGAQPR